MRRQAVRTNPKTGKVEHYYQDLGPRHAVEGHGRPMRAFFGKNTHLPAGSMQLRLRPHGT